MKRPRDSKAPLVRLRPTSDFLAYLMSRGKWVEVVVPEEVRQQLKDLHAEAV